LRKGSKNHQKWNRACDFYINLMLTDQGFERIPTWLWNDGYRGLSSEQIYDALPEEPEDNFDPDLMPPGESDEPSRPEEVQYTMDKLVLQATMQAQKAGCATGVPSDIAFYLQALLNPKLPWEIILKRWFGKYNRKGYSWKKPNKRFNDDYMPSRGRPGFEHAAFATDISGSVSDDDYNRIVSEVAGCMDRMKPTWIHYLQFSETITSISKVKTTRELKKIKFVGRGGTDVRELFEWADKNKPKVLVILTDGEFYWPRENQNDPFDEASPYILPSCDVVWLIHDNPDFVSHYGKVIHYEINK
jgi:predicted metal-dependent peptidase